MQMKKPSVLLVGAGKFGRQHLAEWLRLAEEDAVTITGIVTATEESRSNVARSFDLPAFAGLSEELLGRVDCVDIVTPPATHASLVRQCLPHAHVLVEKPLAASAGEARELGALAKRLERLLVAGHIYRHNPVVRKARELVSEQTGLPMAFDGTMVNPANEFSDSAEINLEFLHFFDIIDYLFGVTPELHWTTRRETAHHISLQYAGKLMTTLKIGWEGKTRLRKFTISYPDCVIECNLTQNLITKTSHHRQTDKIIFGHEPISLRCELQAFLGAVSERRLEETNADTAARIIDIATNTSPRPAMRKRRPRVAIVGAGIFGVTCAQECSRFADVTLFERHSEPMQEVSFTNQWRHHSGFHYPRSYDTVMEIRSTREDFEAEYGEAVRRDYPSYFCPSRWGIEIPAERYLAACQSNRLNFSIESPPAEAIDLSQVSICVKSDEGVYDYYKLKEMVEKRLRKNCAIDAKMGATVLDAKLEAGCKKRLVYQTNNGTEEQPFDYLVNTTYASLNLVSKWFGFPIEPLRFDLYELVVLQVPIEQICITIIDGPFTSLVGIGENNTFLLSHIQQSQLKSVVTDDGLPPDWGECNSNAHNMINDAARYIPALHRAKILRSLFATRAVNAFARDFDARPTVVRSHGFGCWSVLGGKIITCVTNAREIAKSIMDCER